MTMAFKVGDRITICEETKVYQVDTVCGNRIYWVSRKNPKGSPNKREHRCVNSINMKLAPPRPTRKQLKEQIRELKGISNKKPCSQNTVDCKVPLLETRCSELNKLVNELKQQLADAQEAVKIVEALENSPKIYAIYKFVHLPKNWEITDVHNDEHCGEGKTLAEALRAAGLLPETEPEPAQEWHETMEEQ